MEIEKLQKGQSYINRIKVLNLFKASLESKRKNNALKASVTVKIFNNEAQIPFINNIEDAFLFDSMHLENDDYEYIISSIDKLIDSIENHFKAL